MRTSPSRALVLGLLGTVLVLAGAAVPSRAARPRVYALTGGTVVVSPGRTLSGATLVLRDGLVDSVGTSAGVPADAVTIDARGLYVYPGLIDAGGWSPASEAPAAPAERTRGATREPDSGPVHPLALVRPERRAADALRPFEGDRKREAEAWRRIGFTAVLAVPTKGIFRGSSALILLAEDTPVPDLIVRDGVAQHLAFDTVAWGEGYPTSIMGAAAAVRQTLLDAQRYATWTERYANDPVGMPRPERLLAMEALRPVLARTQPLVLDAGSADDILLADRIAREFGVDLVAVASGDETEILSAIAACSRTLIVPARVPEKPKVEDPDAALDVPLREMRRYLDAPLAPKRLADAGVPFVLSARGVTNLADFPGNIRSIIEAGFDDDAVLRALTVAPAKLLGVERTMGTLEVGKIANVVVADGPLFAKETRVKRVFVDGRDYPVEEKARPKGDPNAIVDPRGTWSVTIEFGGSPVQRTWTFAGERGSYTGTAETRSGLVAFESIELAGNALTVRFPATEGRGSSEATVIIVGDGFEGSIETGSRSVPARGTRTRGPEGRS